MKVYKLISLFLLTDFLLYTTPAIAAYKSPINTGNLFIVVGSLLIVLSVIMIIYFILRGKFKAQRAAPFQIGIVNRISIDSKHQIVLLKIDESYLLLGLGDISVLKEMNAKSGIDFRAAIEKLKDNNAETT